MFPAPSGGVLSGPTFRQRFWLPAVAKAGLGNLTPHDLRHTAASLAAAAGVSMEEVRAMLGHTSIRMTADLYTHLFPEVAGRVAGRLDAFHEARVSPPRLRVV